LTGVDLYLAFSFNFDIPITASITLSTTALTNAFLIDVTYLGVPVIDYSTTVSFTASTAMSSLSGLDGGSSEVSVDVLDGGESARYTFTLESPQAIAEGDQIWLVFTEE
jgi:hypothetical protein